MPKGPGYFEFVPLQVCRMERIGHRGLPLSAERMRKQTCQPPTALSRVVRSDSERMSGGTVANAVEAIAACEPMVLGGEECLAPFRRIGSIS